METRGDAQSFASSTKSVYSYKSQQRSSITTHRSNARSDITEEVSLINKYFTSSRDDKRGKLLEKMQSLNSMNEDELHAFIARMQRLREKGKNIEKILPFIEAAQEQLSAII